MLFAADGYIIDCSHVRVCSTWQTWTGSSNISPSIRHIAGPS